jgi:hypothetical protein
MYCTPGVGRKEAMSRSVIGAAPGLSESHDISRHFQMTRGPVLEELPPLPPEDEPPDPGDVVVPITSTTPPLMHPDV